MLDVGCGTGMPMEIIKRSYTRSLTTVGIDAFLPSLKQSKQKGLHNGYVLCDVAHIPFIDKSFDIVLCISVIEHLNQSHGRALIKKAEEIARKHAIIVTPIIFFEHPAIDGNPFQIHKSVWNPEELEQQGWRCNWVFHFCNPMALLKLFSSSLRVLIPVTPGFFLSMVCTKRLTR
jgi:SAM-dependent methyltransferase